MKTSDLFLTIQELKVLLVFEHQLKDHFQKLADNSQKEIYNTYINSQSYIIKTLKEGIKSYERSLNP